MATTKVQITDGRGSYTLEVAADDHLGKVMRSTGRPYEARLLAILTAILESGDVVLDVGANIGNHTVAFARAGAYVEAVEPNPEAAEILARNVALNGLEERVTVHRVGLSDRAGRGTPRVPIPGNLGSATIDPDADGPVQLVTYADLRIARPVRLVKIDVEGAEMPVLRSCLPMLRLQRPLVVVELHTAADRREARSLLRPLGYRMIPVSLAMSPTFAFTASAAVAVSLMRRPAFFQQVADRVARRVAALVPR